MSRVTDINQMFSVAMSFMNDLSKWDVSRVTDMNNMFHGVCVCVRACNGVNVL